MKKITFKIIFFIVASVSLSLQAQVTEINEGTNYLLKNLATGDYLRADGSGVYSFFDGTQALPTDDVALNFFFQHQNTISPGADGEIGTDDDVDHNYTGDFNIQNDTRGMMRANSTATVHTAFKWNSWNSNGGHKKDKRWVVETAVRSGATVFRFKALTSTTGKNPKDRFLFQGTNNSLYNITDDAIVDDTTTATNNQIEVVISDGNADRSYWVLEESSIVLSNKEFDISSVFLTNPVQNQLSINAGNSKINQVTLYSILGSKVFSKKINNQSVANLDVSSLASGLYIASIKGDGGSFTKKIIKE